MYTFQEKVIIWLSCFKFLTLKKRHQLIDMYDDVANLWRYWERDKELITKIVTPEQYDQMSFVMEEAYVNNYIKNFDAMDIKLVTIASDAYPTLLRETISPPYLLYCKGDISLLKSNCFAIVGTRRITRYGREVTNLFAHDITCAGFTIVSGLGDGVDTCAHRACLDAGGKTIAVLGGGFNHIYPASNIPLAKDIIDRGGLIVSEYSPEETPANYTFPARNRIIAGLSRGVLITEATKKSGSMHTKEYALENNRDLFVVPGRITDIYSAGCNEIIKNCQSIMVLSPSEIIATYGKDYNNASGNVEHTQLSFDEQILLDIIGPNEIHYEELLAKSAMEQKSLNTLLMRMELMGTIHKLPGNYYTK